MLIAASLLGMNMTIAHPKGFELDDEYVDFARKAMKKSGGKLEFSHDLMESSQKAIASRLSGVNRQPQM